jgi:hypothetical protein
MARVPNSIGITGPIAPIDEADRYPTHFSQYGFGGYYAVATYSDLANISTSRLGNGEPLVYVIDENRFYLWVNAAWVLISASGTCCEIVGTEADGDNIVSFACGDPPEVLPWFMDNLNFLENNVFT